MNPNQRPNNFNTQNSYQDPTDTHKYSYYADSQGRLRKVRKQQYKSRPGYIRIKFLDSFNRLYKRASYDSKLLWTPWLLGFSGCLFIWAGSLYLSQRELEIEIKSQLPFQFKQEQVDEVYRLLAIHQKQQKTKQKLGKGATMPNYPITFSIIHILMEGGKVTLGYWALRGLGERCRLLLEYCGIEYEQIFYPQDDFSQWFQKDKPKLIEKNPAVTLPYLIDGGKVISESDGVMVYIVHKAKKEELLGRNSDERVGLATAYGVYKDVFTKFGQLLYNPPKDKDFEVAKVEEIQKMKVYLNKLSGLLGENKFIAGQITWFDFALGDFLNVLTIFEPSLFNDVPKLSEYHKRVFALPELTNYFKSDRWHARPCYGSHAVWK